MMYRKKHDRRGSASPPADFVQPLPLALPNDYRNGSIFNTNSVHKPFLSSSASSITGTSIRTELDGGVIFTLTRTILENDIGKVCFCQIGHPVVDFLGMLI